MISGAKIYCHLRCQMNRFKSALRFPAIPSCSIHTQPNSNDRILYLKTSLTKKFQLTQLTVKNFCDKHKFKENIYTIPNALCVLRIAGSPVLGYLIINQQYTTALVLSVVIGLTDLLDGYIARNVPNQSSYLGSALDPLADKILVTILFVSLAFSNLLPVWLAALIIFRDVCLLTGALYIRFITLDPPRTLTKYFDVARPTVQMKPTTISKINTAVQLSLVAASLAAPVFDFVDHPVLQIGWLVTATTTVLSGLGYLSFDKNFTKIK